MFSPTLHGLLAEAAVQTRGSQFSALRKTTKPTEFRILVILCSDHAMPSSCEESESGRALPLQHHFLCFYLPLMQLLGAAAPSSLQLGKVYTSWPEQSAMQIPCTQCIDHETS